ncbi:hypothetical protein PXD04_10405 [Methanosphaera sp. ISO3-F5]|uniref:hypothetical protein n=1 Tax=Methanosphaera sp. ISO3-F5 TaxID=1452353 RepID=UPI002B261D2A|nr:hypothetical protein [Methanosphaera sp. ISO3-F5]WQH64102.1 hypothetical protein PXD04_10405 [Methanosphaera sp. ISO3-F5]
MEFIGYHVFSENYYDLTPDQALFIDYGVMKVYSDMLGGDEKSKKEMDKLRRRSKKYR